MIRSIQLHTRRLFLPLLTAAAIAFWPSSVQAAPTVDNDGGATNLSAGVAQLRGTLAGGPADVSVFWGSTDGGTNGPWSNTVVLTGAGDGPFSCDVSNLLYGLTYYYRCYASNAADGSTAWAPATTNFTTLRPSLMRASGLRVQTYDSTSGASYLDPIANLQAVTPSGTATQVADLAYTSFLGLPGITSDDSLAVLWTGWFDVSKDGTGDYTFGTSSDDGSVLYLDLNGDGNFADAGELIVNNNGDHGPATVTRTVTLNVASVRVAIGFYEAGSGQNMEARFNKGSGIAYGSLAPVNGTSGHFFFEESGASLSLSNSPISGYASTSAVLHATLACPQAVYDVLACWNTVDGGTNATLWGNSTYVGTWTNVASTNLACPLTGLISNMQYFFTFRATNAVDDLWATNVLSFPHSGKDILTFGLQGMPGVISGTNITLTVPNSTDVTALAPLYTVSDFAVGDPPSGSTNDFTSPRTYTVTAEDGSTQTYTVTVTYGSLPTAFFWINGAGNWSVAGNWTNDLATSGGPLPGGGADYSLHFNVPGTYTATHDLDAGFAVNRLNFDGATVTLAGNNLAFVSNGDILPQVNQNGASAVAISSSMTLATNVTLSGTGAGMVTLSGVISGPGSLTKTSAGTLRLFGTNSTFTGRTIVQSGTLYPNVPLTPAGVPGPLGAPTGADATIDLYNGVTLQLGDTNPRRNYTTDRTINLAGTGAGTVSIKANDNDTFFTFGAVTATGTGAKTLALAVGWEFVGGDRTRMNFNGAISDASDGSPVGLQVTYRPQDAGNGKLYLYGVNTFSGPISMSTSKSTQLNTLFIDGTGQLGSGSYSNTISLGAGCTFNYASSATQTLSGVISDAGALTKSGAGALTLSGPNTYSGPTAMAAGTLVVSNSLALQNSTLVYTSGTTTFAGGITNFTLGGLSSSMPMGLTNAAGAAIDLTVGGNGNTTTNSGALSGSGSLTKVGPGVLTLSGTNTYSGVTTVSNGTLRLTSIVALGTGTDVYLTSGGGMLNLDYSGTVVVRALYINGVQQPVRQYDEGNLSAFITGAGSLKPLMGNAAGGILVVR